MDAVQIDDAKGNQRERRTGRRKCKITACWFLTYVERFGQALTDINEAFGKQNKEARHRDADITVATSPLLPRVASDVDAIDHLYDYEPEEKEKSPVASNGHEPDWNGEQKRVAHPDELQKHVETSGHSEKPWKAGEF